MDEIACVYVIRCAPTGEVYVGSSRGVAVRKAAHWARLRSGKHPSRRLQAAGAMHGEEMFEFSVLEVVRDQGRLLEAEGRHIAALSAAEEGRGFNVQVPGGLATVIQLDEASSMPKYQQIVNQVRRLVAAGALAAGAPLPSVRQLASDLGINVNTVLTAYRALEDENIVLVRRGARAVVHPRVARPSPPQAGDIGRIRDELEHVRTDAMLLGMPLDRLRELAAEVFAE